MGWFPAGTSSSSTLHPNSSAWATSKTSEVCKTSEVLIKPIAKLEIVFYNINHTFG
jgi:hypothetical protein